MGHIEQTANHGPERPALVFLGILFFDQILKYSALERILVLDVYKNYDALFGIPFSWHYLAVFFASIGFFLISNRRKAVWADSRPALIPLGLLSGGIFSNLIDRLTKGYILDYLTIFGMFSFNLADIAIYCGVLMLLWKIKK